MRSTQAVGKRSGRSHSREDDGERRPVASRVGVRRGRPRGSDRRVLPGPMRARRPSHRLSPFIFAEASRLRIFPEHPRGSLLSILIYLPFQAACTELAGRRMPDFFWDTRTGRLDPLQLSLPPLLPP
jgi:hypothetical protein